MARRRGASSHAHRFERPGPRHSRLDAATRKRGAAGRRVARAAPSSSRAFPGRAKPGSSPGPLPCRMLPSRATRASSPPSSRSTSSRRSRSSTPRTSSRSATRRSISSTRSARFSVARSSLEEAAATILKEISETVGARRGSILVHDRVTDTLQPVAAIGGALLDIPPIALDDKCSVSARVFRSSTRSSPRATTCRATPRARTVAGRCSRCRSCGRCRTGGMEPLGVVNLSDRCSEPAVQRGRPEAHRGDRDADRHRDSEHATGARVARASSGSSQEMRSRTTCR